MAAFKVVDLAKALALADNHFLSAAVGRLRVQLAPISRPFATDGFNLCINSMLLCSQFKREKVAPKHDLLHVVFHCIFLHPYISADINERFWNLACDIAVERNVAQVCGERPAPQGSEISEAISEIEKQIKGSITAEKIYRELRKGTWSDRIECWSDLFVVDDHAPWYVQDDSSQEAGKSALQIDLRSDNGQCAAQGQSSEDAVDQDGTLSSPAPSEGSAGEAADGADEGKGKGTDPGGSTDAVRGHLAPAPLREISRANREREQEEWRRVAKALAVNLQTYAKSHGKALGGMVSELEEAAHVRVDYSDFLRQFAILGEVLKVSEDEFDYIFYTYGLGLYGNLPLIEPLEYREEKRIREFVIVIDTSGSVQGDVVRRFIGATFDILKSTEAFFEKVHVRIIQCDAQVQSDDVVTSLDELKEWGRTMQIHGCGGTDFRPAFAYVDRLVEDGAFENLGGLVYFTDGWGDYPEWMPDYKVAFVFYDESYRPEIVPTWAAQIVLDEN
ncbi:MAG: VWA-like domain-containing protein, partial [Eggerthellales bacterium]|nr:VWA-like domain-containing protein [Eggerthellales bacterium]